MNIIDRIIVKVKKGKFRQIRVLGILVFEYYKENNKVVNLQMSLFKKCHVEKSKPVFYLKINRNTDYTFLCLQHWIDVLSVSNRDFFILCDNLQLEKEVLRKVIFPNSNIKFIGSCKNSRLKKYVKKIATKWWPKATFAHLTTFYHAKQNNIKEFWNIDADDTMFALEPEDIRSILQNVENYSKTNNIDAISLDMWHSRTRQRHWSFGITYINNFSEIFNILDSLTNTDWQNNYKDCDVAFNLDWFFTYLKDEKKYKIESFYIENCYFIHWGNFLINAIGSSICFWQNGYLNFVILKDIYKDNSLGMVPIADDCIKFSLENNNYSCFEKFANKYISNLKYFPPELKKLHNIK